MNKIRKTLGHCYDSCGWFYCDFWDYETEYEDNHSIKYTTTKCKLFGNAKKMASRSLKVCDKIYGSTYEGEP